MSLFPAPALASVRSAVRQTMAEEVTFSAPGAAGVDAYGQPTTGAATDYGPVPARVHPESATERLAADRIAGETRYTVRVSLSDLADAGLVGPPTDAMTLTWDRAEAQGGDVTLAIHGVIDVKGRGHFYDLLCTEVD